MPDYPDPHVDLPRYFGTQDNFKQFGSHGVPVTDVSHGHASYSQARRFVSSMAGCTTLLYPAMSDVYLPSIEVMGSLGPPLPPTQGFLIILNS